MHNIDEEASIMQQFAHHIRHFLFRKSPLNLYSLRRFYLTFCLFNKWLPLSKPIGKFSILDMPFVSVFCINQYSIFKTIKFHTIEQVCLIFFRACRSFLISTGFHRHVFFHSYVLSWSYFCPGWYWYKSHSALRGV